MLINEFIFKIIAYSNDVNNVTLICCKLNDINVIVSLSEFDGI